MMSARPLGVVEPVMLCPAMGQGGHQALDRRVEGDRGQADDDDAGDGERSLELGAGQVREAADARNAVVELSGDHSRPGEAGGDPDAGQNARQTGGQDDVAQDADGFAPMACAARIRSARIPRTPSIVAIAMGGKAARNSVIFDVSPMPNQTISRPI